jgi:hypothetical protein
MNKRREAYLHMKEGPDDIDEPMIRNVAKQCVLCGRRKQYPKGECEVCQLNPAQYTTQNRANLLRVNAMINIRQGDEVTREWREFKRQESEADKEWCIGMGALILSPLVIYFIVCLVGC